MRTCRMIPPALAAAWCSLGAVSLAQADCPGGVFSFTFQHCPLGNAVLSTNGLGHVIISNVGISGADGAETFIQRVPSIVTAGQLQITEPDSYNEGALLAFGATGVVSESPQSPLFQVQLLREDNAQMDFLSTVTVFPDFNPIGTSSYTAMILSNGVEVAVQPNLSGPVRVADAEFALRGLSPPVLGIVSAQLLSATPGPGLRGEPDPDLHVRLGWNQPVLILLPGAPQPVRGDSLVLAVRAAPGVEISTLQTLRLTGQHLGSITILHASAMALGLGSIPTLSEWGMIAMLCGLLAAGGYLIKRRQPIPA